MLHTASLVSPVIALALWSHVMWLWMYVTRIPEIRRSHMKLDRAAPRGTQMATLPAHIRWKADNYNHLFEQPTVFYAVALGMALIGDASRTSVVLAWAYVALRIVHSLWQATRNIIEVRFGLFVLSSLVLIALTLRAAFLLTSV